MNENEIKIAERFNILDKCQKLEKDFLQLSRITKVEFDLNGLYDNIYQVIILVKYEIPMELGPKKYFRIRTNILKKVLEIAQNNQLIRTDDSIEDYGEYFYIVFDCSSWKYQIQRYTELFKNVYGPEIENPKDGMEKEREVIKTLIKEGLGMLNKARSQALFLDDIEMQEDITNALNIFLAAEEKQQKISPEKNLFEDYTDEELLIFYDCLKKADFYVIPELSKIASKYVSSKRCYLDLIFELSKRWYQEKQKKYKEENGKFHQWLEGEDPLTDNEKYWLSKLGVIIDTVPSDQNNKSHCLYPQGRALKNYSDEYWNTIAPKCINCILITKQKPEATLKDLVNILLSNGKVCTPVIAPDGSIKIGESALCPKIAFIYDSVPEIMEKIRNAKCRACKIPWEKLKETNPIAYLLCENF